MLNPELPLRVRPSFRRGPAHLARRHPTPFSPPAQQQMRCTLLPGFPRRRATAHSPIGVPKQADRALSCPPQHLGRWPPLLLLIVILPCTLQASALHNSSARRAPLNPQQESSYRSMKPRPLRPSINVTLAHPFPVPRDAQNVSDSLSC